VYSPHEGYVLADAQETPVAPPNPTTLAGNTGGMDGMGTTGTTGQVSSAVPITTGRDLLREGSYVASGQTLFKIVNTAALRVELNLPAASASSVKKGSEVMLDFGNGNQTKASVDFIQPFFSEGQEFVTIRVYTDQIDQLHIGHLVNAKIISASIEALWVPEEAVLDLGVDKVVFIRSKNVLRPRKVITGMRTENEIEIKQGLSSSDEIAANAQFLVDSESFIKTQK
jgi:membrane fusion protein, copper/silver efflux system